MDLSAIVNLLQQELGTQVVIGTDDINAKPPVILVPAEHIAEVCQVLHEHPTMYFDYLACITALDNGLEKGTLEAIYNLYSIPFNYQLMIKVSLPRNKPDEPLPIISTVSHIWQAANWHEREAYDLIGIYFTGHPDLRRILLPGDWEGHPLRTDYVQQQSYHGIQVDY
ncbi:MAG: NADH dehydrogenase [Candidatus Amoebophilus sp. 36-38]|nr:MAG: NADH dehydrogenase [Candidatus Amoebophilus sp. 36-38]